MLSHKILFNLAITIISSILFLTSSSAISKSDNILNRPLQLQEHTIDQAVLLLPKWTINKPDNSIIKIQAIDNTNNEEINFGFEPTTETLESYWNTTYKDIKESSTNSTLLLQDTYLGTIPSKLIITINNNKNQPNTCSHHAINKGILYHLNYITTKDNCNDTFFKEYSGIALGVK
jgi:hypothetical protein